MDFIHTRSGDPCFAFHTDNYYDLRERVFMVVERFNQLCAEAERWGRTWVIDRGIFGLGIFAGFRRYGDALITWEKGYKRDAWDDSRPSVLFRRCRERNRPGDLLWWQFCSQESRWQKDRSVRRIIVRVQPPSGATSEVSVLCTNPCMRANDELRRAMDNALKSDSRIRLFVLGNYRRLDTRAKAVMDALRIAARNVFYRLLEVFRPIYQNDRDDHVILRELTRASGVLRRRAGSAFIEVELRPRGSHSQSVRRRIERFLDVMTNQINRHFDGRATPIRITLTESAASPIV